MAGIYIHIPFCKQACHYCNYHFSTNQKLRGAMVKAIVAEWHLRKLKWEKEKFDTLYLGGGTPSILDINELEEIIAEFLPLDSYKEVTLEANPDDITQEKLKAWKSLGINRLSIGIQSFYQRQLEWMNRAHTAEESRSSLEKVFAAGYEHVTIDLIYGLKDQTLKDWASELEMAFQYPINHLSAYQLTVEDKTALKFDLTKGKYKLPRDEVVVEQFNLLMDEIEKRNWEHYEISNCAAQGHRAIHNSQYWSGEKYIGLGPGAHSWDGEYRSWNISNNMKFIRAINQGERPAESEYIDTATHYNEWLMTGLRHIDGLSFSELDQFPAHLQEYFLQEIKSASLKEYLQKNLTSICLTRKGKHLADYIASELMYVG